MQTLSLSEGAWGTYHIGGCDWQDWLKCGGLVVACAASCYTLKAPACIACLGTSYSQCVGCVSKKKQF